MNVQYDKQLDIALGSSRRTKVWKNRQIKWSELLDKLSKTTYTAETVAEYRKLGRNRQSEIKDVGGFVGGYCKEGNRSDVEFRSILCLDADFADAELWPDWCDIYGNAAALYSTHKHTAAHPRYRLVIPLSRNTSPDEYQAVGRRVAQSLGIDKFDDTTYQPQRLMYWPSTSQDGEYAFRYKDGAFLDADEVLATYHDWRDISAWPMSSRVTEVAHKAAEKQQDPLEKRGLVGAFCRAYTIDEAIEEYVPTYAPCDMPGRYTYTEGSTSAGVITYDGKFAYSHHGTDPASGQLCNAWDLVRLHTFADLDEDVDPDTPVNERPSYRAMANLASKDTKVKSQIVSDRVAIADDFEDLGDEVDWTARLKMTEKGAIAQTIENVVTILENDPSLKGAIGYNEMEHSIAIVDSLAWPRPRGQANWEDNDDSNLRMYLEKYYGISGKDRIIDAVSIVAQEHSFHPVREYLEAAEWDGVPRVDTLFIDYLGAEDNAYTRAVTRKTLVAAVARIFNPGCKFDYMTTLRGRQGLGKSALIGKLGGKWFSDTFSTMQGKEAYEQLQGAWIVEIGELAGMRKAEAETIKLYISKSVDRYRPAYGRRIQEYPRQCIFIGTTNEAQFLRDTTGNRRFWIVDTPDEPKKNLWDELTPEVVRKIWAEAVQLYRAGETLYLPKDLEAMARDVQGAYEEENPKSGLIAEYLTRLLPEDWDKMNLFDRRQWLDSDAVGTVQRDIVCSMEIFAEALGGNPQKYDRYAGKEIHDIMATMVPDWRYQGNKRRTMYIYGRQRFYERTVKGGKK